MQILNFLLYFALTVLGLGVLIFVHELGHYLTARACHVTVHEFSLGMGKRLCGFTSKKTGIQYSLRLLPIGGYVAMAGEDEGGEGAGDPNAFCKKNVWQRMLIPTALYHHRVFCRRGAQLCHRTGERRHRSPCR